MRNVWWPVLLLSLAGCSFYNNMAPSGDASAANPYLSLGQPSGDGTRAGRGEGSAVCALVSGDSWAMFDSFYGSTAETIRDYALEGQACRAESVVPIRAAPGDEGPRVGEVPTFFPGTTTVQWQDEFMSGFIATALTRHNASLVVEYIGGNDLVAQYTTAQTPAEVQRDAAATAERMATIITNVRRMTGNGRVRFVLVGYARPNFTDSIENDMDGTNARRWKRMGYPTPRQLNRALAVYTEAYKARLAQLPDTLYVDNQTLLAHGADPSQVTAPEYMAQFGVKVLGVKKGFVDSIHLSRQGQQRIAQHTLSEVARKGWLQRR